MVITRFAPSPTGMLHIGGARTALFNYLFAKKNQGEFLLRIEDTDISRSTEEAKNAIISGLKWLNLQWDGDIVYQSARYSRHVEVAKQMIESGHAYYAYDTPEELEAERKKAEDLKKPYRYISRWREGKAIMPNGVKPVVRIKVPSNQKIVVEDAIKGTVEFNSAEIDDFVILRSDGTPTYMLAVVVDDIDMNISHIIRGDDHLANTPKQILIYQALGKKLPNFSHIPLIHDIEGNKLSKRNSAAAIEDYYDLGYLPEAVNAYLMKLGWSAGVGQDILTLTEATSLFDLSKVGKSPSRFDMAKLNNINLQLLQSKSNDDLINLLLPYLTKKDIIITKKQLEKRQVILTEIKKSSSLLEICEILNPLLEDRPINYSTEILDKLGINKDVMNNLLEFFTTIDQITDDIGTKFKEFLTVNNYKFPVIGPIVRFALIGKTNSVAIAPLLQAAGKDLAIKRLQELLQKLNNSGQ